MSEARPKTPMIGRIFALAILILPTAATAGEEPWRVDDVELDLARADLQWEARRASLDLQRRHGIGANK
jgi:hypothetical protein